MNKILFVLMILTTNLFSQSFSFNPSIKVGYDQDACIGEIRTGELTTDMVCHFDDGERTFTITENGERYQFDVTFEVIYTIDGKASYWKLWAEDMGTFTMTRKCGQPDQATWKPTHGSVNKIEYYVKG